MNILQQYLANRAKPPKNPIMNSPPQVTRAEFDQLARVVEALVEDIDAATSPEKLAAVFNAALEPLANAAPGGVGNRRAPLALPVTGKFTAPAGDDTPVHNSRKPLALPDDGFTAPKGDD